MSTGTVLEKFKVIIVRFPIVRGMVSYGILWPIASGLEDLIAGKKLREVDWKRCIRFSVFGSSAVAPTVYGWFQISSAMFPGNNFKAGLKKAVVDQVSHAPFQHSIFFVGMNILELKGIAEGFDELIKKFFPTWKTALCIWPLVHTLNFALVPERNRVIVISMVSFMWNVVLAYIKKLDKNRMNEHVMPLTYVKSCISIEW